MATSTTPGGLYALAEEWKVPVYAHALEMPYLNGIFLLSCRPTRAVRWGHYGPALTVVSALRPTM